MRDPRKIAEDLLDAVAAKDTATFNEIMAVASDRAIELGITPSPLSTTWTRSSRMRNVGVTVFDVNVAVLERLVDVKLTKTLAQVHKRDAAAQARNVKRLRAAAIRTYNAASGIWTGWNWEINIGDLLDVQGPGLQRDWRAWQRDREIELTHWHLKRVAQWHRSSDVRDNVLRFSAKDQAAVEREYGQEMQQAARSAESYAGSAYNALVELTSTPTHQLLEFARRAAQAEDDATNTTDTWGAFLTEVTALVEVLQDLPPSVEIGSKYGLPWTGLFVTDVVESDLKATRYELRTDERFIQWLLTLKTR